jgi:hypothetical protein
MRHNTERGRAEQLSWQGELSWAVNDQADKLARSGLKSSVAWKSGYGLLAPDSTRIKIAALPTPDRPEPYVAGRTTILDLGDAGSFPLLDMTKITGSGDAWRVVSAYREDAPLAFTIDTRPLFAASSINAVSLSGEVEPSGVVGAHYQAFYEPDGLRVYKVGKDQQLQPVDEIEGGHLLWQVTNSTPTSLAESQ